MPKRNNNNNNQNKIVGTNTAQTNSYPVKANEKLLKEEVEFFITSPSVRSNLFKVSINSKDLRIFELFSKNGGKLTAAEILQNFKYIAANDRVDILKYCIEQLKLNLDKSFEFENEKLNIIHIAAAHGANKCIEYLLSKKYNINEPDGQKIVPLQYAIYSKHIETAKLLIQKGAKIYDCVIDSMAQRYTRDEAIKLLDTIPNIRVKLQSYETYSYLYNENINKNPGLRDMVLGRIEKESESLSQELESIAELVKPRDSYYKLILGKEYHLLPKVIEEQQKLINSKILQLNSTINHDNDAKENIVNHALGIIAEAVNIYEIFNFNDKEALGDYIVEILEENKNHSEFLQKKLVFFSANLMQEFHIQSDHLKSIKYAKIIEENLSVIKALSIEQQAGFFTSLGIIYSDEVNFSKALNYLSTAERLNPVVNKEAADDIIWKKYNIYLNIFKKPQSAIEEAEKITDNDLKSLLLIKASLFLPAMQNKEELNNILLQYSFEKLSPNKFKNNYIKSCIYKKIQIQQYEENSQPELAYYKIYDALLNQEAIANYNSDFTVTLSKYLYLRIKNQNYNETDEFLNRIYQKYPKILNNHNDIFLKKQEFNLYGLNDKSDKILADIKPEMLTNKSWVDLVTTGYMVKFYQANLNQNVKEKLPVYIETLEKLYEYSCNNQLSSKVIHKLKSLIQKGEALKYTLNHEKYSNDKKAEDSVQKVEKVIEIEKQPTVSSNIMIHEPFVRSITKEKKISFNEIEKLIEAEDYEALIPHQKQLENYFEYKKTELQEQQRNEFFDIKKPISWHNDKICFTTESEGVVEIQKNRYAVISSKLAKKLDNETFKEFVKALSKGEVSRSEGVDGVKYEKDLAVLKVASLDLRLFTHKRYLNDDKELIIFNKMGNHDAVSRAANSYTTDNIDASEVIGGSPNYSE
ncbi:MAG TPA: ankyrin repeat domain-containing protein [Rickettsia endosymbiont of Pyrocoelia pectoralis]|nr:ankyrin repeat domain-containing protein [Rickettsia endosymbiont of Pyrocoelia pectoralis]